MQPLSFKITSNPGLLLCVVLSLLWGITDSSTTTTPDERLNTSGAGSTEEKPTTMLSPTTMAPPTTPSPPVTVDDVETETQNESSITLMWKKVDNISDYILQYKEVEDREEIISASDHKESDNITYVVSSLTAATKYNFTLVTRKAGVNSSEFTFQAATAPRNAEEFKSVGQNESSITLQWKKVEDAQKYTIVFDGREKNVTASSAEQVEQTIPGLESATRYDFRLFALFENIRSSGVNYSTPTAPRNAEEFKSFGQNESSITLQWKKVEDAQKYMIVFDGREENFTASSAEQVEQTIPGLKSATRYDFRLFALFENIRSSGVNYSAPTAPRNAEEFKSVGQNESSITLQWKKVEYAQKYTIVFDGREENFTASSAEQVEQTIPGLKSATRYDFRLFALFENIRSSGVNYSAPTAPRNAEEFKSFGQNESSITLQWKKVEDAQKYTIVFDGREKNVTASSAEQVEQTIPGLKSATRYDFSLFALFENIRSSGVNYSAPTAPRNAEEFKSFGQNESSITLQWKKVQDAQKYTIVFDGRVENFTASSAEQVEQTIPGLKSATRYDFSLFALFENIRSSGVNYSAPTGPRNAEEFKSVGQNETSITLQWNKVRDILNYTLVLNGTEINVTASAGRQVTRMIPGLTSGTKYNFSLFTLFENIRSSGVNYIAPTVPSMVTSVRVTVRLVTEIILEWQNLGKEGWSYILQMNGEEVPLHPEPQSKTISHSFKSLKPGTAYPFSVTTEFSKLNSTAYEGFTVTAINCNSATWHVTNSSIQGLIEGLFSIATATNKSQTHHSSGGKYVLFTGLHPGATYEVSLVYERNSERYEQCLHELTITPPVLIGQCEYWEAGYSVFIKWNKPAGVWTSVEVNVTGNTHIVNGSEQQHINISGFLPAKTYEVSLASLSGIVRSYQPFVFSCSTDPRGVIAGSVFAVLLFGVLVCLVVFILLKRPDIISTKKSSLGGSKLSQKKSKSIPVAKFPDHFYHLGADEGRGFSEEYESLIPVGTEQTQKEALLPENKGRNRFTNVLPYDWCRVMLTNPCGTSNYINASYMPGFNSSREYIASQGPLPSTVSDFWTMIWEQGVKGIVMVTNCVENRRTKCEQYWPADGQLCVHGELSVTNRSEQIEPNWTLRDFRVKNKSTSEERTVKHFHFTAWPDHGVPQNTQVLMQFRGLVRNHIEREQDRAPTVVHCSAGVGRTGTIIALDVLLQQLEKERAVGINDFVHKMRLSRPHMVQTESQYVFLHQCIMDSLQHNEMTEYNIYENADMIYENATALKELHRNA